MGIPTYSADDPGSWEWVIEAAEVMDRAGVDRVVLPDHVVFGEHLEQYADPSQGGRAGGRQPTGPDGHWLEPLTTLAVIAGRTSRIRLGTNILIAALRRPVVLAKTLATLDVLSGGRVDLGVGVSWQREEYEAAGLDFGERGRLLNETLETCQRLWRENPVDGIHMMPKPRQPGGVPVWVSGSINPAVVRRLARFGAGWIPWAVDPAEMGPEVTRMQAELAKLERDPAGIRILAALPDDRFDLVAEWAGAGVTDFRVEAPFSGRAISAGAVEEVVARFRAAAG